MSAKNSKIAMFTNKFVHVRLRSVVPVIYCFITVLLERVFLRLGFAQSDEQLQAAVCKFLPPVLLKLSSAQEGVRKKVMQLLIHINKRIKSRPQVQLPVEALLLQYQDPAASSFVIVRRC